MFKKIKITEKNKERIKFILIVIALSLFACIPYLNSGTIFAHDLAYHLSRIINTSEEISFGNFPVFIHSNLLDGFGYGNSIFYPELLLYPAIVLVKLGFGVLFSYKSLILIITIATFIISFYSAKLISKSNKISWITSMLYTLSLYRLVDVYARGALGEVFAFALLPLILAGIYDILYGENKKWYLICFGLFLLINSHIISFVITSILLVIICIINSKKIIKDKSKLKTLLVAFGIAVLLSCSYILPYFEQIVVQDLNVEVHKNNGESLKSNSIDIKEIISDEFVCDGITVTKSIGSLLIILPILLLFMKDKKERKEYSFYLELYVLGIVLLFMSSNIFPWEKFGFLGIIQFPYRLNMFITLFLSFVAGFSVIECFDNKDDIFKLMIIVVLLFSAKYISSVNVNPNSINYEILMSSSLVGNGEYIPVGFSNEDKDVYNIYDFNTKIEYEKIDDKLVFNYVKSENEFKVHVPLTYYKGYVAYVVDKEGEKISDIEVQRNELNSHLLLLSDDNIEGKVVVEYKMTTIQKIGYIISLMTLVIFVNYIIYSKKNEYQV